MAANNIVPFVKVSLTMFNESAVQLVSEPIDDDIRVSYNRIDDWIFSAYSTVNYIDEFQGEISLEDMNEIKVLLNQLKQSCELIRTKINQIEQFAKEQGMYIQNEGEQRTDQKIHRLVRKVDQLAA